MNVLLHCFKGMAKVLFRVKVIGDQSVFKQDKLLLIANHESFLDGVLLALFLPIKPVFVVHYSVLRNPFLRFFLHFCEYLPVESTQPMAIKKVLKLIKENRPVIIFPEGRISVTGGIMKIYDGPAFIAAKSNANVIPLRISGTSLSYFTRLSDAHPRQYFPQVTIHIMPSRHINLLEIGTAKQKRRDASEKMRLTMQEMVFTTIDMEGTIYENLLKARKIQGKHYKIFEDINQTPFDYQYFLKATLALGRLINRISEPEQKIGVLMPNLASTAALIFAVSSQNRIPAMLNFSSGAEGIQSACTAANIHLVVTSRQFIEKSKLQDVIDQLHDLQIVYLEDLRAQFGIWDKLWLLWHLQCPKSVEKKNEIAVILFTSGSEGKPKGVALSHSAILANLAQLRSVIAINAEDKFFNALPMFHSFGLTVGTLFPLLQGIRVFSYPSPLHYRIIPELIYDKNCTILAGTNTFLAKYAHFAHPYDFYALRYVIAGAEKLQDTTRDLWLNKFGIRILEGYGATEAAPVISTCTPMAYKAGSVGQFLPGIQYKLKPIEGIADGGLLYIKGPNVMSGYYKCDQPGVLQRTASEYGMGWYETGDVVDVDGEGFIHIKGRVKRFAKIAGEMVGLETAERMALHVDTEFMHAAIAVPDEKRGEQIILYTTDKNLSREQLVTAAQELHLPELAIPKKIIFLENFPLLGSGKADYVKLKILADI